MPVPAKRTEISLSPPFRVEQGGGIKCVAL
jgi:hypothetical protein